MKETRIEKAALAVTAIGSLPVGVASIVYLLIALHALAEIRPAWGQSSTAVRLEAGMAKEDVDGDLKAAMDIYQKIAADTSAPRDVRSKALLRLGGCYEKLGGQARQIYEQLVREFGDQPAATQARSRLTAIARQEPGPPPTMTVRKIERAPTGRFDVNSTDGLRAVYRDSTGSLFFGDLAGHSKRLVLKAAPDERFTWAPSRDFSMVWLRFPAKAGRPATMAVVRSDGTGYRELIRDEEPGPLPEDVRLASWSWDSRWFLLHTLLENGGSRLTLVSAADGQHRELAQMNTGYFQKAVFSPDGRFVAYEVFVLQGGPSRVFVLPVQGGEPHMVYESVLTSALLDIPVLVDWTADGRNLAISDARQGRIALYLLPMRNGAAAGDPAFVQYGKFGEGYITAAGSLVYQSVKPGGADVVSLASLAPDGHVTGWRRVEVRGDNPHLNPWPSFSPDSRQIAYAAQDQDQTSASLVLRELSTGRERVLYRADSGQVSCVFATRHPKVFCAEMKPGHSDLVSIAVESGEVERLGSVSGGALWQVSHDDNFLYLLNFTIENGVEKGELLMWDLTARQSPQAVARISQSSIIPSLDDRWLLQFEDRQLRARPLSGGDWKALAHIAQMTTNRPTTTPDGKWVLYADKDAAGKLSLFRTSIEGGEPQRIGDLPVDGNWFTLHISPDGRQLMAVTAVKDADLWVLENFAPAVKQ